LLTRHTQVLLAGSGKITSFADGLNRQLDIMYWNVNWFSEIVNNVWFKHYPSNGYTTAFLFTAVLFICCAVIGLTTNIDLSKLGGILFAGLLCLIIVSIVSFFIPVLRQSLFLSYAGVIIFLLYTAYDVQRIRVMYEACRNNSDYLNRFSTYGAFQLYLDFINLFLNIIRIVSSSRSSRD
jgi:FtsH-binding integral membrane protein